MKTMKYYHDLYLKFHEKISDFGKFEEPVKNWLQRAWSCSEGLEYIWDENNEKLLWLVLKMWCFIVSWCFWKIYEQQIMDYVWAITSAHQVKVGM